MWIFLSDSFLSVVQYKQDPKYLLVRARYRGDISRIFGKKVPVVFSSATDYQYRAVLPRKTVAEVLKKQVLDITYENFKDSVEDPDRHAAYFQVWLSMLEATKPDLGLKRGEVREVGRKQHVRGSMRPR